MTSVYVASRLEQLDPFAEAWDRLAEANGRPLSRPGWLLTWWRARLAEGLVAGELRVILVFDDHGLAAVAPMFLEDVGARLLNLHFLGRGAFVGPHLLVRRTATAETMGAVAAAIAALRPHPGIVFFDAVDVQCQWPRALVRRWPGAGAWVRVSPAIRATGIRVTGTFEEWVHARGRHWRQDYWRRQRRFSEHGGSLRRAQSAQEVRRGLNALVRLHEVRWGGASSGDRIGRVVDRTLREAGKNLVAGNAFRLWTAEIAGEIVGVTVFTAVGGAVTLLLTAFDPRWGRFAPGQFSMVAGIEQAFRRGDHFVDLSFGEFPYKFRLANEVRWISSYEVFPRNYRYPLVRAYTLPRHARETVDQARARLRARTRLSEVRDRITRNAGRSARR